MNIEPSAFIFFGPSGCGKGTQAKLLIKYLEANHADHKVLYVETGRLLREFGGTQHSYAARKTKEIIDGGRLLPEYVPISVWGNYLMQYFTGDEHLVFDGVSRRVNEAPVLDSALGFYNRNVRHALFINVSKEWSLEKLLQRGRADDNHKGITRRLKWFDENVRPAVGFFEYNPAYHFHEINGEQSIEGVHKEILQKAGLMG